MRPYIIVKVGEMLLRKALQNHMLASQGLGTGEACRLSVGDDCSKSKGKRVTRHAGNLRGGGGLRCLGLKYDNVQRGRMTFIRRCMP
jgi:hypothetical protein